MKLRAHELQYAADGARTAIRGSITLAEGAYNLLKGIGKLLVFIVAFAWSGIKDGIAAIETKEENKTRSGTKKDE